MSLANAINAYLPAGVKYNPKASNLIAIDDDAIISIDRQAQSENRLYYLHPRFGDSKFNRLMSGDYRAGLPKGHEWTPTIPGRTNAPLYSGAEHGSSVAIVHPKLPNITVVPNIFAMPSALLVEQRQMEKSFTFGCTMGHWHAETSRQAGVQEVYEFLNYGLLVIDKPVTGNEATWRGVRWEDDLRAWVDYTLPDEEEYGVEFWIAKPFDKLVIPQQCHITLYNLGGIRSPLVTLDFADPRHNHSNKTLIERIGPIMRIHHFVEEGVRQVEFRINPAYYRPVDGRSAGKGELTSALMGRSMLPDHGQAVVKIALANNIDDLGIGKAIYDRLCDEKSSIRKRFKDLGIRICPALPEINVDGLWIRRGLIKATQLETPLYRHFFGEVDLHIMPPPRAKRSLVEGEDEFSRNGLNMIGGRTWSGNPTILVEGAGDWTNGTFVPALQYLLRQSGAEPMYVVIADARDGELPEEYRHLHEAFRDPRWRYLNKKIDKGREVYSNLAPQVVLVATPDHTHAALCEYHLEAENVLEILVEKPMDTESAKIDRLIEKQRRLARQKGTETFRRHYYAISQQGADKRTARQEWEKLIDKARGGERPDHEAPARESILRDLEQFLEEALVSGGHEQWRPVLQGGRGTDEWQQLLDSLVERRELRNLDYFIRRIGLGRTAQIHALDHYYYYVWPLKARPGETTHLRDIAANLVALDALPPPTDTDDWNLLQATSDWLGGGLSRVVFSLAEIKPIIEGDAHAIGLGRSGSLGSGMIYDLFPHGLALLAYFCDLTTLDDLRIKRLGRYRNTDRTGQPYDIGEAETCAELEFTLQDYSASGRVVQGRAWVGKGLAKERKFLWVEGHEGRSVLFALSKKGPTAWLHPDRGEQIAAEPGIYFLKSDGPPTTASHMAATDGQRYYQLLLDMWRKSGQRPPGTLPPMGGRAVVEALERLRHAQQAFRQKLLHDAGEQLESYDLKAWDWDLD